MAEAMRTTSDMSRRQLAWKAWPHWRTCAPSLIVDMQIAHGPVGRGGGGGGGGGIGGAGRGLAGVTTFLATLRREERSSSRSSERCTVWTVPSSKATRAVR